MEILYSENARIKKAASIPIGTLRMSQTYGSSTNTFSKKNYGNMRQHLLNSISDREEIGKAQYYSVRWRRNYESSGRCDRDLKGYYPLKNIQNYKLNIKSIDSINRLFWKMKPEVVTKRTEANNRNRAETITAGLCIITTLMFKLAFEEVTVSSSGLREGVLSSFLSPRDIKNNTNNRKTIMPPTLNAQQLS